MGHTVANIKRNAIKPFPSDVSSECRSLIRSLLSPSARNRPRLREISENKWLCKNAKSYAIKIRRPELFVPSLRQRVRFRDRSPSISSKGQESPGLVMDDVEEIPRPSGCFGGHRILRRLSSLLGRLAAKK